MPTFEVPVFWEMQAIMIIEAKDKQAAIDKAFKVWEVASEFAEGPTYGPDSFKVVDHSVIEKK